MNLMGYTRAIFLKLTLSQDLRLEKRILKVAEARKAWKMRGGGGVGEAADGIAGPWLAHTENPTAVIAR